MPAELHKPFRAQGARTRQEAMLGSVATALMIKGFFYFNN